MAERTSKRRSRKGPAGKAVRADGTYQAVRYSQGVAHRICARIAQGEAWVRIANTEGMPSYDSLYVWRDRHPEFAEMLAQARETAAELRADLAVLAAEAATKDTVQVDRLKVSAYQKFAANPTIRGRGERTAKRGREDAADRPRRLIVEIRRFEKVTNEAGETVLREIMPERRPERGR